MSPLNDLLAAIEAEANEERAHMEAESQAKAEAILQKAREEANAEREGIQHAAEPALRADTGRRVARARLEASRLLREAREESYDLLLSGTRSELTALREDERYRRVLRALLGEGLRALPNARILRVDLRDGALAAELLWELGQELEIEPTLQTSGGLELESGDGRTLRNTVEERLANAEPELRLWYGQRLAESTEEAR